MLAAAYTSSQKDINHPMHFQKICDSVNTYTATVSSEVVLSNGRRKAMAKMNLCKCNGKWKEANGNILLQIRGESLDVIYGDRLLIKGFPRKVKLSGNPYQFEYRNYLNKKNIFFIDFLTRKNFVKYKHDPPNILISYTIKIRKYFIKKLDILLEGNSERGVAQAILLGQKKSLDKETKMAFSKTGVSHLLAVSGLHVGIIFHIVILLLNRSINYKRLTPTTGSISIIIIWFYALITGLSPSVLRASLMFSLYILGDLFNRQVNIFNIIFTTGCVLLLYNPLNLLDIGFQLSFAAVISIVSIYPLLSKLYVTNYAFTAYIWNLLCISMSAQIGTFPIVLYYFHQFPIYFLLANVFAVPFSFLILLLGWGFLLVSLIFENGIYIIGLVLNFCLYSLNKIIFFIEDIPFSSLDIYIDRTDLILMYGIIMSSIFLIYYKKISLAYLVMLSSTLIITKNIYQGISAEKQQVLTIYKTSGNSVYSFIKGKLANIWADSTFKKYDYVVKPHLLHMGISKMERYNLYASASVKGGKLVSFAEKNIFFIRKEFHGIISEEIDYVIISNNPKMQFSFEDTTHLRTRVILDASNSLITEEKLLKKYSFLKRKIYSVRKQGAFILAYPFY